MRETQINYFLYFRKTYHLYLKYLLMVSSILQLSQSINGISSLFSYTRSSLVSVHCVQIGADGDSIYYSVFDMIFNQFQVERYSILTVTAAMSSPVPLMVYNLNDQVATPNKLLQVKSLYIISYSSYNLAAQIYNIIDGTRLSIRNFASTVTQILYSTLRDQIYVIYLNGDIQSWALNTFVGIQPIPVTPITIDTIGSQVKAKISPGDVYLGVGTYTTGMIKIYDLSMKTLFYSYPTACPDASKFEWHSNMDRIYVYNQLNGILTETQIVTPYLFNNYVISATIYQVHDIRYIYKTSQIYIIGSPSGTPLVLQYLTYSILTLSSIVHYTGPITHQIKGVAFAKNMYVPSLKFAYWQASPNLYITVQQVNIVAPYVPPQNPIPNPIIFNGTGNVSLLFQSSDYYEPFQNLIDNLFINNVPLTYLNRVPSIRNLLKPIFLFFSNFDDLWLYNYHQVSYNQIIEKMFSQIRRLQNEKWQTFNYKQLWQNYIGLNVSFFQQKLNFNSKLQFTSLKFLQIQGCSNGYMLNTIDFYMINLQFIILTYVVGKILFTILSHSKVRIKQLFEKYDFTLYIFILILQGNIQFMMYLFGFQMMSLVEVNYQEKIVEIIVLVINFFFIFQSTALFFLIQHKYNQKGISLCDNFSSVRHGSIYLTFQWSIKNMIFGLVHIMIPQSYYTEKITVLIIIELSSTVMNILHFNLRQRQGFVIKTRIWINVFCCLSRVALISTFLITTVEQIDMLFIGEVNMIILINYFLLWIVSMIFETFTFVVDIKKLFQPNKRVMIKNEYEFNSFQHDNNFLQDQIQLMKRLDKKSPKKSTIKQTFSLSPQIVFNDSISESIVDKTNSLWQQTKQLSSGNADDTKQQAEKRNSRIKDQLSQTRTQMLVVKSNKRKIMNGNNIQVINEKRIKNLALKNKLKNNILVVSEIKQ